MRRLLFFVLPGPILLWLALGLLVIPEALLKVTSRKPQVKDEWARYGLAPGAC